LACNWVIVDVIIVIVEKVERLFLLLLRRRVGKNSVHASKFVATITRRIGVRQRAEV
jgi:hypothetical protein